MGPYKVSVDWSRSVFLLDSVDRYRTAPNHADTVFATRFLLVVSYLNRYYGVSDESPACAAGIASHIPLDWWHGNCVRLVVPSSRTLGLGTATVMLNSTGLACDGLRTERGR